MRRLDEFKPNLRRLRDYKNQLKTFYKNQFFQYLNISFVSLINVLRRPFYFCANKGKLGLTEEQLDP